MIGVYMLSHMVDHDSKWLNPHNSVWLILVSKDNNIKPLHGYNQLPTLWEHLNYAMIWVQPGYHYDSSNYWRHSAGRWRIEAIVVSNCYQHRLIAASWCINHGSLICHSQCYRPTRKQPLYIYIMSMYIHCSLPTTSHLLLSYPNHPWWRTSPVCLLTITTSTSSVPAALCYDPESKWSNLAICGR